MSFTLQFRVYFDNLLLTLRPKWDRQMNRYEWYDSSPERDGLVSSEINSYIWQNCWVIVALPHRSSSSADPSPQECLQLLVRATQVFREEYIQKFEQAREEIARRYCQLFHITCLWHSVFMSSSFLISLLRIRCFNMALLVLRLLLVKLQNVNCVKFSFT